LEQDDMDQLLVGYERFRRGYWRHHRHEFVERAQQGQSPWAMVIACCDSRVPPEIIFDCAPGEIFVVRSIANLIPTYAPDMANHGTSAALEYAVKELNVRQIILLGHSLCGGIRALVQGSASKPADFIGIWMNIAAKAGQKARNALHEHGDLDAACRLCEQESIRTSLNNFMTFPWIKSRIDEGMLNVHGFHFDMVSGDLEQIHPLANKPQEEAARV
jgi:carbonic anhydrase